MNNSLFISKIKEFYFSYKHLSFLLIFNFLFFLALSEKFYVFFFFLFILYFFGSVFSRKIKIIHLLFSYICGLCTGFFVYQLWQNKYIDLTDFTSLSPAIQTAIITVLTTLTAYIPQYPLKIAIINIKLKYITLILIIINLLSVHIPALYLAHLCGVAVGLLYGFILKNGLSFNYKYFIKTIKGFKYSKPRMKAEYNKKRPLSDDEYNSNRAEKQKKTDYILDKISKNGYDSLTKEEKDFLFNTSKN